MLIRVVSLVHATLKSRWKDQNEIIWLPQLLLLPFSSSPTLTPKHTMHIFINSATSYLLLFLLVFLHGHHAFQISPGAQLDKIHQITTNEAAVGCVENQYELVPIPIPTNNYKSEEEKAELAANLIEDTKGIGNYELIHSSLRHLLKEETVVDEVLLQKNHSCGNVSITGVCI